MASIATAQSGAPLTGAAAVVAAGLIVLPLNDLGPLSIQMTQHLLLMNVAAPVLAVVLARSAPRFGRRALWSAAAAQLALLWGWHLPAVQQAASTSALLQAALLLVLAAAALSFWLAVIAAEREGAWRAIAGLLLTGKFACLLGALLIFAPRDLYGLSGLVLAFCRSGPSSLDDQQLAGLLMVTACPLSYLTAGVVIAARLLAFPADRPEAHVAGAR
jgi:putative membrane protein